MVPTEKFKSSPSFPTIIAENDLISAKAINQNMCNTKVLLYNLSQVFENGDRVVNLWPTDQNCGSVEVVEDGKQVWTDEVRHTCSVRLLDRFSVP
eukprot:scaffold5684_cov169-Amphora_coffeaeformis.AAC.6